MFLDPKLPSHVWSHIAIDPTGCWLWTAYRDRQGYGRMRWKGRTGLFAHRIFYSALVGRLEDGLVLDHLCRTPACVNPAHLEQVTRLENARRGRYGVLTTHCPAGHPYDERNTYRYTTRSGFSRRCCRACNRAHKAKAAKRGAVSP